MVPKLSAPLIKDIRTGEGILEWVLAAIGVLAGATGNLSISKTGLYLTILAVSKSVRRLLLKVVAAQKQLGIGAPLPVPPWLSFGTSATIPVSTTSTGTGWTGTESALASITTAQAGAAQVQAEPGTPAEQVSAGLAPSDPPVPPVAS